MRAVLLAGGLGTRMSEETAVRPKPMVEIGGEPILWHIMKLYASYGITDFVVCCGYKGHLIKEYFASYVMRSSDVSFDLGTGTMTLLRRHDEPWKVTLVDTGQDTMTGGRLARIAGMVGDETFCLTYGDGLADVDMDALIASHQSTGALVTLTAVDPPGRFGAIVLSDSESRISHFREKPSGEGAYVNGGYFVVQPAALDYIRDGDGTVWEREPLQELARDGHLAAYRHNGFFQPMDTLRDRQVLEELWASGAAPWKRW